MNTTRWFNNVLGARAGRAQAAFCGIVLAISAVMLVESAAANVLVNDTWKDGTDTDPSPANGHAENNGFIGTDADADGDIESMWFVGGTGATLNPVEANGPLRGSVGTTSASWTTHFTPEATPVNLAAEGDKLLITWVFTPTGVNSTSTSQAFRVAIADFPSAARLTNINGSATPIAAAYTGYAMFMNMRTTIGHSGGFQLRERTELGESDILGTTNNWGTQLGNGTTQNRMGYADGREYTFTFEITRTAGGLFDILTRMEDPTGNLDDDGLAEVSLTGLTPNANKFTFDTFVVRPSSAADSAMTFDTSLFKVEFITSSPPPTLNGDYNNNGFVDAADYVLWRNGGPLQNDPTPGVQPEDYNTWRANFGRALGSGSIQSSGTTVPEPATLTLLAVAGLGLFIVRSRLR